MSVRNLDRMFAPRSVALIGASQRERSIGGLVAQNLIGGGFAGPVWLVNPRHKELYGRPVHPSVEALPETPDLAVIATPPATVPGIVDALARRGTGAAAVITAFPTRQAGAVADLKLPMLQAARPALLRVLGPNGIGLLVPGIRLNASFSHLPARPGPLAFLAQSGALVTAMLDWAEPRGIGFSHVVSMGDMADVDFGDMLDFLATYRGDHTCAQVHVGRTDGRAHQAGDRHQGRALCRGRARGGLAHRRAGRRRRGL
jgi:acetyltransferase